MEKIFFIFHDGLSQWWTPEAQAHIKARGFEFRQMRILHSTYVEVSARYKWKLVGDSPELCCGPNCPLASVEEPGNTLREAWNTGDPELLFRCLPRTG